MGSIFHSRIERRETQVLPELHCYSVQKGRSFIGGRESESRGPCLHAHVNLFAYVIIFKIKYQNQKDSLLEFWPLMARHMQQRRMKSHAVSATSPTGQKWQAEPSIKWYFEVKHQAQCCPFITCIIWSAWEKHVKGPSTTHSSLTERKNPSVFSGERSIYWKRKTLFKSKKEDINPFLWLIWLRAVKSF